MQGLEIEFLITFLFEKQTEKIINRVFLTPLQPFCK